MASPVMPVSASDTGTFSVVTRHFRFEATTPAGWIPAAVVFLRGGQPDQGRVDGSGRGRAASERPRHFVLCGQRRSRYGSGIG